MQARITRAGTTHDGRFAPPWPSTPHRRAAGHDHLVHNRTGRWRGRSPCCEIGLRGDMTPLACIPRPRVNIWIVPKGAYPVDA